jgi:hypothetical protein
VTGIVDAAVAIAQVLGVSVEYIVIGRDIKPKSVRYSSEAKTGTEIIQQMTDSNRKMAVT